jgi:glycosyltransferase involved in cell wall biosynthesis
VDVVVFLGTSWAELEHHNTRWRAVTTTWARHAAVSSVRVVEFPHFGAKAWLRLRTLAEPTSSWHPTIGCVHAAVPLLSRRTPFDSVVWSGVARALRKVLRPTPDTVGIAASPLWSPVLPRVGFGRIGFDAVDDLRFHARLQHVRAHIERGYAVANDFDFATAVSAELANRLASDVGLKAEVVPNGVDVDLYRGASVVPLPAALRDRLPAASFAVYVGRLNVKIDFAVLRAVAARMPVVIAGPATPDVAPQVESLGATWLGPVDTNFVPDLLRRASVGLVPFVVNDLTRSMDSMKVLEYLAAGLDVVTTPLPALAGVTPRITPADGADAFATAAAAAAARGRHDDADPVVLARSWSATAARLLALARGA